VLYTHRNDVHFPGADLNRTVAQIDAQLALDDKESLVGVFVPVPNELTLQLHDLELIVVHFGDDPGLPLLGEQPEFLPKVDRAVIHYAFAS
jgi:hypothetical protein